MICSIIRETYPPRAETGINRDTYRKRLPCFLAMAVKMEKGWRESPECAGSLGLKELSKEVRLVSVACVEDLNINATRGAHAVRLKIRISWLS
jgi:hypothetical protein